MARKFLPALRGLSSPSSGELVVAQESKSLVMPGYSSTTYYGGSGGWRSSSGVSTRADYWDMDAVVTEGYERTVWVYRSVELIAGHASRLKFAAGRNLGTEIEERLDSHPLYKVLNRRANPIEKGKHFKKRLSAQVLLSKKGAFVEVTKSRAGTIVRLDLLDPARVRIISDDMNGDYIKHYEYTRLDGQIREIDPERIRWIREPHPTDPFCGVTPLEAAGLSVELDFLSRLYNSSFIKNDSRPGGVLGVDSDSLTDQEMDRLESKFRPGAQHAGEMTVIGTGPGGMNYVDTTTKPRDMAYGEASQNARHEILSAFGIGESMLGDASGRTYDNAESELYSFWTTVMVPHLDLIADAFEEDIDEGWEPFFDTSHVEVLELPRRRDREEARNEYQQGLRTIDEYRPLANLKPLAVAQARALWVNPSKAPIPHPDHPEDAAALGLGGDMGGGAGGDMGGAVPPDGGGMPPEGGPGGPAGPQGGGEAAQVLAEAQAELTGAAAPAEGAPLGAEGGDAAAALAEAQGEASTSPGPGDAAAAVAEAGVDYSGPVEGDAAAMLEEAKRSRGRREGKSLTIEGKSVVVAPEEITSDIDENAATTLTLAVTAALEALMARQQAVITARLESPKTRKGTRFWQADSAMDTRGGDAPIDAPKVVDADRWEAETLDTTAPLTSQAGSEAASRLLEELAAAGVIVGGAAAAAELASVAAVVAAAPAGMATLIAGAAIRELLDEVTDVIRTSSVAAPRISDVQDAVRTVYAQKSHELAMEVGEAVARATINGARDAAAKSLIAMPDPTGEAPMTPIVKQWTTMGDDKVRPAHRAAAGRLQMIDEPFEMDGWHVRFPQDPLAPPHLRYGCRCWLRYKVHGSARLIAPPPTEVGPAA